MSSLMMAVSISLIVPTIMSVTSPSSESPDSRTDSDILILSHTIAITLLTIFVLYLYFQFNTHAWFLNARNDHGATHENHQSVIRADSISMLGLCATSCILICTTLCVIICAFHLVGSVDGLAKALDINKTFISLFLIPPTGYSAKYVTIIAMARRCQMDSVIKSIINSILQIILFIIPFLVLFGWLLKQPFTLDFNLFEATVFFITLIVMTCTIQDGKSNYFDGIMLIGT
jgi:Ca2+:H+ antiporter